MIAKLNINSKFVKECYCVYCRDIDFKIEISIKDIIFYYATIAILNGSFFYNHVLLLIAEFADFESKIIEKSNCRL